MQFAPIANTRQQGKKKEESTMSAVTPTATTPPRNRHGNWWDGGHPPPYQFDYENGHHVYNQGDSSPGGPPPPPPPGHYSHYHPPAPSDYWSYEGAHYYDGPPRPERDGMEQSRISRGVPHRPYPYQQYGHGPTSPRSAYIHGPGYRDTRHPPRDYPPAGESVPTDKKTGDPLSILANVSAGMTGKDGRKKRGHEHEPGYEGRRHVPIPAPTSPLQRRSRPSPITPNQTPQDKSQRGRHATPNTNARSHEDHPHPDFRSDPGYADFQPDPLFSPRRRGGEFGGPPQYPEGSPPALVEHGSFDSHGNGEMPQYREGLYSPKTPPSGGRHYYDQQPRPPPFGYWDGYQYSQQGTHAPYPPPRWNYNMHQEPYHPEYRYDSQGDRFPYHGPPPPPMPPMNHPNPAPYTYVQQPRLEEKTVLRKKFSWKHYPEVRFELLWFADW